jgi:hypothetical protein
MAIELTTLSELDATKVDAMITKLAQYMQEQHPEVELTRGVFHDLVLYFNGMLNAAIQENVDRVRQSQSLYAILQNPALADDTVVDQVLSNYNLSRSVGKPAVGVATVILNLPLTTKFTATDSIVANDIRFTPAETFVALPPGSTIVNSGDRVMVPVGDGTYAINITLVATVPGAAGNVRRGATLLPNFVPNNTLLIYAGADFTGGEDPPTNADYIKMLPSALAAKTVGSRQSYIAAIKEQAAFQNTLHISLLGCGDPEQQRDQHSLFPISGGGKVDVYAQTNAYAQERDHLLEAVYIGPATTGTRWQVILDKNTAPGFYEVRRVAKPTDTTSSGYGIVGDVRDVNLTEALFVPDVRYLAETAYTRYQTAAIRFEDVDTPTTGLVPNVSRAYYSVRTASMPLIGELNDFLTSRDNRPRGTDVLVKAAVPCFTKISFQIRTETNETISADTITAIKQAVVDAVAGVGFSGQLHASLIDKAAHSYLSGRQAVSKIDMFGRIRRPDGTVAYVRDPAILRIPNDPARMVTGRTTAFLVGPDDVSVSTVAAGFLS